jgi:hypothetical protein
MTLLLRLPAQYPINQIEMVLESAILPNINWLHVIFVASMVSCARAAKDHKSAESVQRKMSQAFM